MYTTYELNETRIMHIDIATQVVLDKFKAATIRVVRILDTKTSVVDAADAVGLAHEIVEAVIHEMNQK